MTQTKRFDHTAESVGEARRFVSRAIRGAPADIVEAVVLAVSELASNCVRHTDGGFEVTVQRSPGEIRVQASDRGTGKPVVRSPGPEDPSGRGLQIVDMLAADWGVEALPEKGKTVWFTVMVPVREPANPR